MFPITITIHNQAQLNLVAAALNGQAKEPAPKPAAAAPEAAHGQATAKVQEVAAPEKTASAPSPAAESAAAQPQASTAATSSDSKPLTYEDVKPLILDLTKAKGREVAAGALAKFGAAKGPELKPEQFAEFVAHAKSLLAESALA